MPPDNDNVHPTSTDYTHIGYRDAQTIINYFGLTGGSYSGAGPSIAAVTFSGSTVLVKLELNGATGIVNASSSTTAGMLTGWVVTDSKGATVSSYAFRQPDEIVITMNRPMSPTDTVTVKYLQGQNPSYSNAVYSNVAPGRDTMNLPLLPSIGTLTASQSSVR